ncbi:MAG: hypothetical protein AAFZ07_17680 [Actinomycetota bacterium]
MPPFGELPLDGVVATFRSALDRSLGLENGRRQEAATSVTSAPLLAGTGLVLVTAAGRHRLIACDPAVVERVAELATRHGTPDLGELSYELRRRGAEEVEVAALQVVHHQGLRPIELPDGGSLRRRPGREAAAELAELAAACPDEHRDPAGLAGAEPTAVTFAVDADGAILAAVTETPAALAPGFSELVVQVRPSARGQGWGASSVAAAAVACFGAGRLPMFRNAIGHGVALRLAARVGFRRVGELWVSRFEDAVAA